MSVFGGGRVFFYPKTVQILFVIAIKFKFDMCPVKKEIYFWNFAHQKENNTAEFNMNSVWMKLFCFTWNVFLPSVLKTKNGNIHLLSWKHFCDFFSERCVWMDFQTKKIKVV